VIKIDFFNFLIVGLFLIVWNALFQVINIEARRNKWHIPAAVAGLHS
jgi:hypothetical protein